MQNPKSHNLNIREIASQMKAIQEAAVVEYTSLVNDILHTSCTDIKHIKHVLNFLLDFADSGECLILYKKLCRYLYTLSPEITAEYIYSWRETWDEEYIEKLEAE